MAPVLTVAATRRRADAGRTFLGKHTIRRGNRSAFVSVSMAPFAPAGSGSVACAVA
jgi:hypothetical protein